MAYRLLARNQPVPQPVALAAQGEFLNIFLYKLMCFG